MNNSEIEEYLVRLDDEVHHIKKEFFTISWYMRGGVNINDLFHTYTNDDIEIMNAIIQSNIETTQKSRMPLI